jgi:hypothetical protein
MVKESQGVNRLQIIDLIKFYSEWLYEPVDEEMENKLYFLDLDGDNTVEDYFYKHVQKDKTKMHGIKYLKI